MNDYDHECPECGKPAVFALHDAPTFRFGSYYWLLQCKHCEHLFWQSPRYIPREALDNV